MYITMDASDINKMSWSELRTQANKIWDKSPAELSDIDNLVLDIYKKSFHPLQKPVK